MALVCGFILHCCSKNHQCISHGHLGQVTAFKWYANGCRSLEDLKAGKGGVKLTAQQEIGIRFYDGIRTIFIVLFPLQRFVVDINSRMPRSEAKAIFDLIKPRGKIFYIIICFTFH